MRKALGIKHVDSICSEKKLSRERPIETIVFLEAAQLLLPRDRLPSSSEQYWAILYLEYD